jgi:uncharacterized phage protein (TIGR02218 family)
VHSWPAPLIAETQLNPTTLCRLFVLTPVGGTALRFTDHDADITVDGDLYQADHSFQPSAVQSSIGGANQNLELTVLFIDTRIGYAAVMGGLFQGASLEIYLASFGVPTAGKGIIMAGRVGSFTCPSKLYGVMSVIGNTGKMDRTLTEVYQPTCRADFGDTRCGVSLAGFSEAFAVASVTDDMLFVTGITAADGTYNLGSLVWATGANAGKAQEVAYSLATGAVALFYPAAYAVQPGDTGTIYRGCAKTVAACTAYGNLPQFRGEPYVPGDDYKQVT